MFRTELNCEIQWVGDYLTELGGVNSDDLREYMDNNEAEVDLLDEIIALEFAYLTLFCKVYGVSQNIPETLNRMRVQKVKQYEETYNKKYIRHQDFIF